MNSEIVVTLSRVMVAVIMLAIVWLIGGGVLPLLKSLTGLAEEKRAMARKGIESIDALIAEHSGELVTSVIHEVAEKTHFAPDDAFMVSLSNSTLLAEMLKTFNVISRQTPERLSAEEIADAANDVVGVLARLTDSIPSNALPDMRVKMPPDAK